MLLSEDGAVKQKQMDQLKANADPAVYAETVKLDPEVRKAGKEARLPLIDMALATLHELSPSQYEAFVRNVVSLVEADDQIDLFEYTLQRMIRRGLDPVFDMAKEKKAIHYYGIEGVLPQCGDILSCLANWGSDTIEDARKAFAAGAQRLGALGKIEMKSSEESGLQALDDALNVLDAAAPRVKKAIIDACIVCIGFDRKVTVDEAELVRAIGDSLDCPIPPIMPDKKAA